MKNQVYYSLRKIGTTSPVDVDIRACETEIGAQMEYELNDSGCGYLEFRSQSLASVLHCLLFGGSSTGNSPDNSLAEPLEIVSYSLLDNPREYTVVTVPPSVYEAELENKDAYKYELNFVHAMSSKPFFQGLPTASVNNL